MSLKDKWVRRFSVDETSKHKDGFTIYKITSVLFPLSSPEAVTVVSVWKRFSNVKQLHKAMKAMHAGLHLKGAFPELTSQSFFKRFDPEVIQERARMTKDLLEFLAEHRLLFSSTEFVNFLRTGYPEPERTSSGVIDAIRSSLHLPIEETPPLEYHTSDDDSRNSEQNAPPPQNSQSNTPNPASTDDAHDDTEFNISNIQIFEAADVEMNPLRSDIPSPSVESLNSLESIGSDLFESVAKIDLKDTRKAVKPLPDLIDFEAPSTSKFGDYHRMRRDSELSRLSLSNASSATRTEDGYVFEAGCLLSAARRATDLADYQRAFDYCKAAVEVMLTGVRVDPDPQRRRLIKEKINVYLSYAEDIYTSHLSGAEPSLLAATTESHSYGVHCSLPTRLLQRPYSELAMYRVLHVLGPSVVLVRSEEQRHSLMAIKIVQKIPNNLTDFDEYILQHTVETKQPILPTNIPYMVNLISYIETNNLIFLILTYAPGKKLFDYINNYAKSAPNTPMREVNLENVFPDSQKYRNDNETSRDEIDCALKDLDVIGNSKVNDRKRNDKNKTDKLEINENDDTDLSINELVKNSQTLLLSVDKVLREPKKLDINVNEFKENVNMEDTTESSVKEEVLQSRHTPKAPLYERASFARDCLPRSAVALWAAEMLTAIEGLHNSGVICRDLNPSNILLGDGGHVTLTYFLGYRGPDTPPAVLHKRTKPGAINMYIAPEIYHSCVLEPVGECSEAVDRASDLWSFGAVLYELLCGVPLSMYHRSVFTAHTILFIPEGLDVEAESLLTQLLTFEPAYRLGFGDMSAIKQHPFFKHVEWGVVRDTAGYRV